jgi:hypothetical protein
MDETPSLSAAVAKSSMILSLLGPNSFGALAPYREYYSKLFPLMREHGVKRIMAMSTVSAKDPDDSFNLIAFLLVMIVRLLVPAAYKVMVEIAKVFEEEAKDLEWTIFRLPGLPGGHDEKSWKKDREDATHAGYIGDGVWRYWTRRGGLARWLVDCAEKGQDQWIHKLPAVSNLSNRKAKTN